jgi:acetyl-CoA carboxylase biotin carboxyl carrier protein
MAQSAGKQTPEKKSSLKKSISGLEKHGWVDRSNGIAHSMTDLEFLRGLIEAVDQSGIDSLEINRAGTRIRIAKTPPAAPLTVHPAFTSSATGGGALPNGVPAATGATAGPVAPAADAASPTAVPERTQLVDVTSPMVGTFYRAPAPDAPPYVEAGTQVTRGQTLCILEAMKLMNELDCEVDGVVREILVEDADPVEFGQVLFRIEPAGLK